MSIARFAVQRPIATFMIILAALILGGVALGRLELALLPDFNFPAAVVITEYENVGPQEVESQITRPIEEAMATVRNVNQVSSTSSAGSSTVVVQFNWGTDMDFAALEMRERLDLIRGLLPDGAGEPQVFRFDPSLAPMYQLNVGGMDDLASLRQFVEDHIVDRLERLEGVAQVNVSGGLEREIRIEVDQAKLNAFGLTMDQVRQAVAAGNLNMPGGRLTEPTRELTLRTVGEFTDVGQIGRTVVHAGPAGVVRVEDVARVVDGYKEQRTLSRLNGQPSVAVTIQREAQANTVVVSDRIRAELARLQEEFGDQITIQEVWDEAEFIRLSIQSVTNNVLQGAIIAMVVLFVFLRTLGPTLIIGSAIPVAGLATFFFLYVLDVSLNILSLGGLALGVGMLVDNAIVSLENAVRHRQMGKAPKEAAIDGTGEVGMALTASTLTTVAVFLPIVFVGGLTAELFRDLSFAVVFSLAMSLVVALTFVPMLAARVNIPVSQYGGAEGASRKDLFDRVRDRYRAFLGWILRRRYVAVLVVTAALVSAVLLVPRVGQEFLPVTDTGSIGVRVRLPYGSTLEETDAIVRELEEFVSGIPEVEVVYASAGGSDSSESGVLAVNLVQQSERERSTEEVVEEIRQFASTIPGAEILVAMENPYTGGGGGGGAPIQLRLKGRDTEQLLELAEAVAARVAEVPGTREVETSTRRGRPELQVVIDRDRAARYGLTVAQIASAIRTAMDGAVATQYRPGGGGSEIEVRVQLAPEWRDNLAAVERLLISTPVGAHVPLSEVARIAEGVAPVTIEREDQSRVVFVYSHISGRDLSSVVADIAKVVSAMNLPDDVEWGFGGDTAEMEEAFRDLAFALLLAVVLVYMIMAAQFESLVHPLVIMATVPLGFTGVVWALVVSNRSLSVPGFVGVIVLAGIAVNNGIVMIDMVNQLRRQGKSRLEAMLEGCSNRLRPVLMTTLTTVLGMVPLALGIGEGSELGAPIATVIIGGLTVSTLLTLGFVPVAYTIVDDLGGWLARVFRVGRRGSEKEVRA
ncbi:MAG: efflux RND transporter permease subunit [Firmicutes bacterium]|nr:efflux RND transporter permease subunit [Bacillota bacterium]